jgi:condensin complex subunit 1
MADTFHLQDELQALSDISTYDIQNEHDIRSEDPASLLEQAVEAVADSSDSITDPHIFDIYRSILKHADGVPGPVMSKPLDSISSGLAAQVDATVRDIEQENHQEMVLREAHKAPLEMYAFLLQWFVSAAEKVKAPSEEEGPVATPARPRRGRGGKSAAATARTPAAKKKDSWTWIDQIPATLALISKVLRLKTHRIWTTTPERDAFITCVHPFLRVLTPRS